MKIVDTCDIVVYNPLILAIKAMYQSLPGEEIKIIMNNKSSFKDLKDYLSEQEIGFREIYDDERLTLQFVMPNS